MTVTAYLNYYENEDGDAWAEIAEYPDGAAAAQQYADERGMIVQLVGETRIPIQNCECYEEKAECPDGRPVSRRPWRRFWRREWHTEPCVFRQKVPCWHLFTGEHPDDFDEDPTLYFPHDKQGRSLILGHAYSATDWQHSAAGYCHATEQEHYSAHPEMVPTPRVITDADPNV